VQQADESLRLRSPNRVAGIARGADFGEHVVDPRVEPDPDEIRERTHDVAHHQVAEVEAARENLGFCLAQFTVAMARAQHGAQFVDRMRLVPFRREFNAPARAG